jgi:DNA-binding winged helix-turn-helix (wHTH) protein/tetratricopeptide (TPR) repeat protein
MLTLGGERYEFGEFVLEASERRLSKHGQAVPLEPKAFDLLVALVRHAGRLATKQELLGLVWPESFVEEGILAVHVSALRKVLSDSGRGRQYIETVARSGYRFVCTVVPQEGPAQRLSIAVLPARPFTAEILSGRDRETGLTLADALIDRLGRFRQIVVRPMRAVHHYAHAEENLAKVGQSLRVDAVLFASFTRSADRVRVSARLIRSTDGANLWSGEFEESASDIIGIAESLAGSAMAYLGLNAGLNSETQSWKRKAFPPEVYELFGRGRFHLLQSSAFEVPKAVDAFRAAIELAPTYAAAHAGLALAQCARAEFRVAPPSEAYREAKDAALRALAMDDWCADAQVALGAVLFWSEWNWAGARRCVERALEINPNQTEAYLLYGRLLEAHSRIDEGLAMKLKALERDPFSPLVNLQVSISYFLQRNYDDAIEWANKALQFDPHHPHAREHLAAAYLKKGDFGSYMAENIKHAEMQGVPASALEPLKQAYSECGTAGLWKLFLCRASSQPDAFPAMQLAMAYGEAGDIDAAFRYLDRALETHDPGLVHIAVGPQWDSLRSDPRFQERVTRMGFQQTL